MHPHVLLQRVVVVASLLADRAHEVRHFRVCGHVSSQGRLAAEGLLAGFAHKRTFAGVDHQVGLEVVLVREELLAEVALVDRVTARRAPNLPYDRISAGEELVLGEGGGPGVHRGTVGLGLGLDLLLRIIVRLQVFGLNRRRGGHVQSSKVFDFYPSWLLLFVFVITKHFLVGFLGGAEIEYRVFRDPVLLLLNSWLLLHILL